MVMPAFNFAKVPPIYFGAGKLKLLPKLISQFKAAAILLVTGEQSLQATGKLRQIEVMLQSVGIEVHPVICKGEPTTSLIDRVCADYRAANIDGVVAIGGGSVVDAGKAISAMLPHQNSVLDHLEGVGRGIPHSGVKKTFIAIPTTSGTGGEVTKNAVISEVGPHGYKKSLRHDNLIPDAVIVDGELLTACPRHVTAACGMDALTQLLEPYLSPTASPLTDAIAWSGLAAIKDNLMLACGTGSNDISVREGMAYASLMSGIALANAGLGIVHGLASPIGGFFPIPHGVVCGTLVAASVRTNVRALWSRTPESPALEKLARLGELLAEQSFASKEAACDALVKVLDDWTKALALPKLREYGIQPSDLDKILAKTANRNNPIELSREEIRALVMERL